MSENTARDQNLPLLKVNDLHVYYGAIHAVKGISLEVHEGEIVTLIGANGAGKSTTLNTIAGLLKPRQGSIVLGGIPVDGTGASKMVYKGLSLCPEGRRIFQHMTVRENLEMGAYSRPKEEIEASLADVFSRFPRLKEREKQIGGTLSGGEQQMLAMARALMSKPKLMMLDEPSMGLAPILVDQIFGIIQELHDSGVTILLVEQNAQMALSVADRAYVLETGRISMSPAERRRTESLSWKLKRIYQSTGRHKAAGAFCLFVRIFRNPVKQAHLSGGFLRFGFRIRENRLGFRPGGRASRPLFRRDHQRSR